MRNPPTAFDSGYSVASKRTRGAAGDVVIKEDAHQPLQSQRLPEPVKNRGCGQRIRTRP